MAQSTKRTPLKILLIGKTGVGKSATGNSILGRKAFNTSSYATSNTRGVTDEWAEHGAYEIQVVDGPGLEDTDLDAVEDKKQACENMSKALMMCNGGVHAFVLVMRLGFKFTKEERKTISDLKETFGENYLKDHGIIVITGGDSFSRIMEEDGTPGKTFEDWCRGQVTDFGNLIQECSPRVVLFNNISKCEDEKTKQRNELLFHAGKLEQEKGLYTNKHFKEQAKVREKGIKEGNQNILQETFQKRINLLSADLEQLTTDSSLEDVLKIDVRIEALYTKIREKNVQEESLQTLTDSLNRLRASTKKLKKAITEKDEMAMKQCLEVILHQNVELKILRQSPWGAFARGIGIGIGVVAVIGVGAVALGAGAAISVASGGALDPAASSMNKALLDGCRDYLAQTSLLLTSGVPVYRLPDLVTVPSELENFFTT